MRPKITKYYSPNFDLIKRSKNKIKFVIIHYTGMKKESLAIKRLCNPVAKVSSHYFIKKNGSILELVPDLYEAWHAGESKWKNLKSLNKYSIGIEINNPGHEHGYKKFSSKQILSVQKILKYLIKKYKIKYKNILGHSDVAPSRKKDPGEKFPWHKLAQKKLCLGHKLNQNKIKVFRKKKISLNEKKIFLKNLYNIGYSRLNTINYNKNKILLIKAFQRRFRQSLIDGHIDKECYLISKNL
jgi:N-acetylmuramoyl-L-alanine amidase